MHIQKTICTFNSRDPDEFCFERVVMFIDELRMSSLVRMIELQVQGDISDVVTEKLLALNAAYIDREDLTFIYAGAEPLYLEDSKTMQIEFEGIALIELRLHERTKTAHKAVRFVKVTPDDVREYYFYAHDRRSRRS
ncbi:MAG: hypothetical protein F6J87_06875 [Spirulina sp. SIO3F2]|nr:hypothetical protein [Spirulina sp. SIO3F2]